MVIPKPFLGRFDLSKSLQPVKNFEESFKNMWMVPAVFASQFMFVNPAFAEVDPWVTSQPQGFPQNLIELNKAVIVQLE